jgi:hypothetical protein
MTAVKADSVIKTLLILFAVAVSPCLLAAMVFVFYVWAGVTFSRG